MLNLTELHLALVTAKKIEPKLTLTDLMIVLHIAKETTPRDGRPVLVTPPNVAAALGMTVSGGIGALAKISKGRLRGGTVVKQGLGLISSPFSEAGFPLRRVAYILTARGKTLISGLSRDLDMDFNPTTRDDILQALIDQKEAPFIKFI